ncbi:hypothetical protein EYF80_060637 [Liparis tanakae]|uniref:Uncharacterized protein n=1 Tax=Liparis tanakae TaxID=230148 RepID=A0A4Z2EK27_9TELE|nr:hypothetical protein EYF80_060637 [Liparis tanakae]
MSAASLRRQRNRMSERSGATRPLLMKRPPSALSLQIITISSASRATPQKLWRLHDFTDGKQSQDIGGGGGGAPPVIRLEELREVEELEELREVEELRVVEELRSWRSWRS